MDSNYVDDTLKKDLAHVSNLEADQLRSLVLIVIEFMVQKKSQNFLISLEEFAANCTLSPAALKVVSRALIIIFESGMKEGWSSSTLQNVFLKYGLTNESCEVIRTEWQKNASTIASKLLSNTIAANELVDVDWSFGVTASTNDCDQVYLYMCICVYMSIIYMYMYMLCDCFYE